MVSPPTASRLLLAIATLGAAAAVVALLSCWNVGWLSDDWVLLDGAQHGTFLEELRHVTVPRRALWWASMHGAGPWLFRLVAIGCHVAASVVVLPRLGRLFFPAWPIATGYLAGLGLLGLPVAFDAMVWPATVAYPILELELLAVAYAHLRWLRGGGRAWRVGSVLATAAALGTWELGISAPLVVAVLSVLTAARGRRAIRDVAPHALLLGPWLVLKLGLSSTARLEWLGVTRLVGHVLAAPLLALSPWPLNYRFLTSPAGAVLAVAVFVLALAAAWRVSREGTALLTLAVAVLLPVLPGPGPEARYLMLAAPWLVLLATAATRAVVVRSGPAGYVVLALAFVAFYGVAGAASWWMAARWRTAGAISRDILDGVARLARADGRRDIVVIDAPDRLAGWGPTSKVWVWRNGLSDALAMHGLRLVAQVHTAPGDPEVVGLRPSTLAWTPDDRAQWQAKNLLVLVCRPNGSGRYDVVPFLQ
jgi:hypothetical protein